MRVLTGTALHPEVFPGAVPGCQKFQFPVGMPEMPPPSIHQPHDKLLKSTFSKTENAAAFFKNYLPEALVGFFDWESLRQIPSSFIDPRFLSSESDLVFQVSYKDHAAVLYLLFEHQSEEDTMMAFRLLYYTLQIWQAFRLENPRAQRLPAVMGLVLAQNRSPWKSPLSLDALIDIPAPLEELLRPLQPKLEFRLVELLKIPYDQLRGTPEGVLTLRALKADPVGELLSAPLWDPALLEAVSGDALEWFLRYALDRHSSREEIYHWIRNVPSKKLESALMTITEQIHAEGLTQGRAEGERSALRKAVLQALRIRHGNIPSGIQEELESIGSSTLLESLLDSALRSESVEHFLRTLHRKT